MKSIIVAVVALLASVSRVMAADAGAPSGAGPATHLLSRILQLDGHLSRRQRRLWFWPKPMVSCGRVERQL